jgi:hypothetical protein
MLDSAEAADYQPGSGLWRLTNAISGEEVINLYFNVILGYQFIPLFLKEMAGHNTNRLGHR